MRSSALSSAVLGFVHVLSSFSSKALVEPKTAVAATTMAWGRRVAKMTPKVLPFYADDAELWGMLSPTVRSD